MTAEQIANALGGRKAGGGWTARCPAHYDRTPGLSIGDVRDGNVLARCHSGCDRDRIIALARARHVDAVPDLQNLELDPLSGLTSEPSYGRAWRTKLRRRNFDSISNQATVLMTNEPKNTPNLHLIFDPNAEQPAVADPFNPRRRGSISHLQRPASSQNETGLSHRNRGAVMDALVRAGRKPPTTDSALLPLAVPVKVAAQLIGVSRSTLWVLIKQQEVETISIGRKRLVLHASLQALIENRRAKETALTRDRRAQETRRV